LPSPSAVTNDSLLDQIAGTEEEVGIKSDKNRELPERSYENFASLHEGLKKRAGASEETSVKDQETERLN
jgi:hypothetical protein